MPIYGDLRTVTLIDLLRWASTNEKTGVLEVERNAISRRVEFRKGWVGSCSSNDPAARLGQYLLSRGRLNETQLQHLLTLQRATHKRLGLLLVEMAILSRSEFTTLVTAKAQETIHSLFDWDDAFFRFDDGATLDPDQIEVHLSVEDLIAEGQKRCQTVEQIRETFPSSGIVLTRSGQEIPGEVQQSRMTSRIVDSIDGQRTIAEILLHTRASEFLVLQFLYRLYRRNLVTITETRTVPAESFTLLDVSRSRRVNSLDAPIAASEVDRALTKMEPPDPSDQHSSLDVEIAAATRLIDEGNFESAVELLRTTCREHSTDYVRRLLQRAESLFLDSVKQDGSFGTRVPILLQDRELLLGRELAPEESFLLSLIDGSTDVQSVLGLAPLREVEVLMALRRMVKKNMIELAAPVSVEPELQPALV